LVDDPLTVSAAGQSPSRFQALRRRLFGAPKASTSGYKYLVEKGKFHGWRMGVLLGCLSSSIVLICNIALVVVGTRTYSGYDKDGVSTILEGDEAGISGLNTLIHVIINALSTILLSASNYTMQVLISPTRDEIDSAHGAGKWFEIGLFSLRNLRIVSRKRAILCVVLAISSLPLHLL
jgi:hypothetical protein